jgi:hypothetical protein
MPNSNFSKMDSGASTSRVELVRDDASIPRPSNDELAALAKAGTAPNLAARRARLSVTRNELDALSQDGIAVLPDMLGGVHRVAVDKIPKGHTVLLTADIDPQSEHGIAVIQALYDNNPDARSVLDKHGYKR